MTLDEDRPSQDDVIYVKSVDGAPPDPTFERIMTYTLGDDMTEYHFRVHGGDTAAQIRGERPKKTSWENAWSSNVRGRRNAGG
jgi:hypothetical protein